MSHARYGVQGVFGNAGHGRQHTDWDVNIRVAVPDVRFSFDPGWIKTPGMGEQDLFRDNGVRPLFDGHPEWSPDDSEIAYASFRDPGKASIVRMMADGTEILDLTPLGADDNDPDYLPDGRIVFKTDRFSTAPEVRIAVMNVDGTGVAQLTSVNGVSDHDPITNNTVTLFERFMKNTDYTTDPALNFTTWNIIEANLDGSGERTLLTDGWINWLPVFDPTSQYIVYLKSVGYTDARLLNKKWQGTWSVNTRPHWHTIY